ncbi:T9SS-dependent choice-of-anchor J family protein [Flavobacterium urocaniciphilum]|uniref:Por secretion system C-terminal sorting domain-containing protein n=1 Tax=Flavobacterium urocaniciphilum TaxID=1299341 RepID=A0A1H9DAW8_9FLAO|nr:choice-of-anchor J domain-containing protein [Flavobacterium urocaniciphilum]SEQ10457.1 Por secretion system C-terminal sorting domain-containing protein [Flavobacterium urocaniciphilum]
MKKIIFLICLLFAFTQINAQTWTINSCSAELGGNTYGPMNSVSSANATNRTATIYPASQVGALTGKLLTSMYFKRTNATLTMAGTPNFKIYLKEVSMSDWGSAALDWATAITGATLVYDNNPAAIVGSTVGWKSFPLTGSFTYSGTQNLAVFMEYQNTTASSTISWSYEYTAPCITTSNNNTTKYLNNTSGTYPTSLTSSNYRRPMIGFDFPVSCPTPTVLTTSGITSNSVNINWTPGGSETEWAYVVQPQGTGYPTGAGTQIFAAPPYTAGGLNPATNYEVYVRANCAPGDSSIWLGPVNFTTLCSPITTLPHLEPFATFLPSICWFNRTGGDLTTGPTSTTGSGWVADGFGNVGSTGAVKNEIWATGANDWLISPEITIPAVGYELKFDAAATQWNGTIVPTTPWETDDSIEVLVSSTGLTNWTVLHTYNDTNQPSNMGTSLSLDLDAYAGQTIRLAFRAIEGGTNGLADIDFSIDNFQVRLTPTCPDVTGLTIGNISGTTADTSWGDASGNGALGYEYAITTSATPPASGTATTLTYYAASGLTPLTTYYLHVRAECAGSTYGNWSTSTFTTGCAAITTLPYLEPFATFLPSVCWFNRTGGDITTGPTSTTGSGWVADGLGNVGTTGAVRNEIWTTGANDWLISPQVTIPTTGYELRFVAAATQFGTTNVPTNVWETDDFIEVLVSSTGLTNWTVLHTYNDTNQPATTATPLTLDLDAYAGQTIRLAFRAVEGATNGSADIDFSIDDFEIRLSPSCPDINGLTVGNITGTTADTSWSDASGNGAVGYEYAITATATPPASGTATTLTYYAATGLSPLTTYYLHVRATCAGSTYGVWVTTSFTTGCSPVTVFPHLEPFATYLPSVCWSEADNGDLTAGPATISATASSWLADGFANVGTTGAARITIDGAVDNDWILSPQFTIPATGYELKFKAAANQSGGTVAPTTAWETDDFVEVLVSTTGTNNWSVLYTYNDTNVPSNTGSLKIIDLDAFAGQTVRFAYRAFEGTSNGAASIDFFIDDFQVRQSPACADQTGLVVSGMTFTTANTSWDDLSGSGVTGYEYAVTTSATPPASGTPTTNTYYLATGLTGQTVYYLHVRTDCGSGNYGVWSTLSFFTGYCTPSSSGSASYISNFTTTGGSQNISNLASGFTTGGYLNATSQFVEGYATSAFSFNGTIVGGTVGFAIWIDWNNDLILNNATEKVFNTTAYGNGPFTGTITIPAGTPIGNYRMRVATDFNSSNPSNPCAAVTRGEFEDYTVSVIAQPACLPPSPSSSNVTSASADLNWAAVASATLGYEYVLDNVATDPAGSGTSITPNTYSASGLTGSTTYYFHVRSVCGAGVYSTWSTINFTTLPTPPVNDNLCNATALTLGTPTGITQTLVGATAQTSEPVPACFNSGINGSVWYSFIAPTSGTVEVTTDFAGGTLGSGDTEIAVYAGTGVTCSDLTTLAANLGCDQDGGTTVGFSSFISVAALTPGNTYYVQVDRWGTATAGTFGIQVSEVLGSSTFDTSNFVAYPNPVKDILNLSYNSAITKVSVVNLLGQEVLNNNVNGNDIQVNMSTLSAGAYIVNITADDIIHTIKVIKE